MRVLIHAEQPGPLADILRARHPDVEAACCDDYPGLPAALARHRPAVLYTIRFAGTPGYPHAAVVEAPGLNWVAVGGSGTDHLAPWDPERLTVTNAAGVAADMMAQYVLGMALAFRLNLPHFAAQQRARRWDEGTVDPIDGLTVAVIGLGHTGRAVARLADAIGLRAIGVRAKPAPTPHVARVEPPARLAAVLAEADIVAIAVPLTAATRGLLNDAAFAAMKPGAILVDVSRGGVVEQDALVRALRAGRLRGAALDVFETEPLPPDHPLWEMPNVIVTPHCSSVYDGWERRSMEMFCDNLARWRRGEALCNIVDPTRGY